MSKTTAARLLLLEVAKHVKKLTKVLIEEPSLVNDEGIKEHVTNLLSTIGEVNDALDEM